MKRLALFLLFLAYAFTANAVDIVVIPLKGEVTEAQFFFLRRALKESERDGASAVILDMDTYGGELKAAVKMLDALFHSEIPTYTYIDTNAGSAGALIALSTKHIYMAPVSAIGAAAPVSSGGQDIQETMKKKTVSYFSGYFRSAAERNGYRPELAEAFINEDMEYKIGDTMLTPKGALLTLSAQEAVKPYDGKPLLADGIAASIPDLVKMAKLQGNIRRVEPSGFEQVAFWITALAPLFLLGGIVGTYIEIKTPGFGIPGCVAAFCFLVYFTGHYLAGLAGLEAIAIFVCGIALIVIDLVVFPGTILLGLMGVVLVLGSLVWAMIDRYPGQSWVPTTDMLVWPMANLGIALVLAVIAVIVLLRFLPNTPLYHRLVLAGASPAGPSLPVAGIASASLVSPGDKGITLTQLRPSGKAEFGTRVIDVVTQGDFLARLTPVRVRIVEGSRVVVEAA